MRVATYNIRNMVALDWNSCWFRRRSRLATAIRGIDVDVWAMQEAYKPQVRYLKERALPWWTPVGEGRNIRGGEACPIWLRDDWSFGSVTRWFGEQPEKAGSKLLGAGFPRVTTIAVIEGPHGRFGIANTHLDEKSAERRRASLEQLAGWFTDHMPGLPHLIVGDLNATLDSTPLRVMLDAGYRSALAPEDGPTSNGFGDEKHAKQIDHVLASPGVRLGDAVIRRDAGFVSDHWPVVVDVHFHGSGTEVDPP